MTNEAIKALMVLVLYGVLEIVLVSSPIGSFAKRTVPFRSRRTADCEFENKAPAE
jgi:hypothetical protein